MKKGNISENVREAYNYYVSCSNANKFNHSVRNQARKNYAFHLFAEACEEEGLKAIDVIGKI